MAVPSSSTLQECWWSLFPNVLCRLTAVVTEQYVGIGTLTEPLRVVRVSLQGLVKLLEIKRWLLLYIRIKRLIHREVWLKRKV